MTYRLGGWAASTVDSLDTMLLMGLNEQYEEAIPYVAQLTFDEVLPRRVYQFMTLTWRLQDKSVQFFETVIRYLGGLLSVYAMNKNPLFLARADDLGRRLLPAFNTTHGLPAFYVNVKT